ncbi:18679_t:CDS:2, partial [Gigaspora rosea]
LKLTINELNERVRDKYWSTVSGEDIERTEIKELLAMTVNNSTSWVGRWQIGFSPEQRSKM